MNLLTKREIEILKLTCRGMTCKEIARTLFISYKTADKHLYHIRKKTGQHRTALLVQWAMQKHLISPNPSDFCILTTGAEFGFRQAEKGHNLETALYELRKAYYGPISEVPALPQKETSGKNK